MSNNDISEMINIVIIQFKKNKNKLQQLIRQKCLLTGTPPIPCLPGEPGSPFDPGAP